MQLSAMNATSSVDIFGRPCTYIEKKLARVSILLSSQIAQPQLENTRNRVYVETQIGFCVTGAANGAFRMAEKCYAAYQSLVSTSACQS